MKVHQIQLKSTEFLGHPVAIEISDIRHLAPPSEDFVSRSYDLCHGLNYVEFMGEAAESVPRKAMGYTGANSYRGWK